MSRYEHDYEAFGKAVLSAPWMVAEMDRRAAAGAARARAVAPVDETGDHPGRYRDSITHESGIREETGRYKSRAVGRVIAADPAAFHIEFGTSDTPAHRTLGQALDAMGGT